MSVRRLLSFGAMAALPALLSAQTETPSIDAATDSFLVAEMRARGIPGLAYAVVRDGKVVRASGFGTGNLENGSAVGASSVFEIASITKQFTAAAVMMLVEEGKVRLDDRIGAHLERTPQAWKDITVRHLLTHTSGLPIDAIVGSGGSALLDISTSAAFEFIARAPLLFAPGERASYSDAGYFLLGMIIERASGQSYRDFLQRRIFDPLAMTRSSVVDRWRIVKDHVPVYTLRNGQLANWRRDWQYELPSFFGILSTVEDLARWDAALRDERLLSRESREAMWTPARLAGGGDAIVGGQLYGFGFELGNVRGHRTAGHSGASGTYILRFLDEPVTIIVLTNLDLAAGPHAAVLARRIAERVSPAYAPPYRLAPGRDPDPATTIVLRGLLAEMAQERESPAMTASHRAFFRALPPARRAQLAARLGGITSLAFIAEDTVARPWASAEPVRRIVHYRAATPGAPLFVSFELTGAGTVATLRLAP